jgi:hypothetical protein
MVARFLVPEQTLMTGLNNHADFLNTHGKLAQFADQVFLHQQKSGVASCAGLGQQMPHGDLRRGRCF